MVADYLVTSEATGTVTPAQGFGVRIKRGVSLRL
jgi:hypothetical protein